MNTNKSMTMPLWLQNQLSKAFQRKDVRNLRMLNDCWFFYRDRIDADVSDSPPSSSDRRDLSSNPPTTPIPSQSRQH